MALSLKILGSSSATPAFGRHQTSQLLTIQQQSFLLDCGEGTQSQLNNYHMRFNKINYVFISHMHVDHYLGLIGLISTMHLQRRMHELHMFGPPELPEIITPALKAAGIKLNFKINFTALRMGVSERIYENDMVTVDTIPLVHRVPCMGFMFREKPKMRQVNREKLPQELSLLDIAKLKKGEHIYNTDGSIKFNNEDLTMPPKRQLSYAYCSDTKYHEPVLPIIEGADLLYHESTFLNELQPRANQTFHSTTVEAATIALKANVGKLLIGHFSARYKDLAPFEREARVVFPNTELAVEGLDVVIED